MTHCMMSRNLRASLTGLLALTLFGTLVGACTYDEAKYYCTHGDPYHPTEGGGGFSGPGLEGCVVGAHEVGPRYNNAADSDADCKSRFNVQSIPYKDNADWMTQTSEMIDRRNGCHYGAIGHLRSQALMDGGVYSGGNGCLEQVDAGGNVQCQPDPGIGMGD